MTEPIKVGTEYFNKKKDKKVEYTYQDVKYDADKWADVTKFVPADFDLVFVKVEGRKKSIPAWINGKNWDGANFRQEFKVLYWKRHE